MSSTRVEEQCANDPEPYRMHVSQRYLDLTRQKLELARLPRETGNDSAIKTSQRLTRADIEPLLDYWLEEFDFRAQEAHLNERLPQFRLHLRNLRNDKNEVDTAALRVHFVHKRSTHERAIPLLFCHDWGSSFIEVLPAIEALCEPVATPTQAQSQSPAFHVICPSIPGFGYGDVMDDPAAGVADTARAFGALMQDLGYESYIAYGSGWGFKVALSAASQFPRSCKAVFASNPSIPSPNPDKHPLAWLKYHIARLTGATISWLSFGYVPSDFKLERRKELATEPQDDSLVCELDLSFALADSPTGLLAFMMQLMQLMQPGSLQQKTREETGSKRKDSGLTLDISSTPWSPAKILTWTMLYWLPGPEVPLIWLQNAQEETRPGAAFWQSLGQTPVGITFLRASTPVRMSLCPPPWTAAYCNIAWLRRHQMERPVKWPAWEEPDVFVLDIRAFVLDLQREGLQLP